MLSRSCGLEVVAVADSTGASRTPTTECEKSKDDQDDAEDQPKIVAG